MRKGRQDLAVETDIVNLLKQLRAIWTILDMKLHTSKKDVEQIMKSQRRTIDRHVDPEEDYDEESAFIKKITLSGYDPTKAQDGETT